MAFWTSVNLYNPMGRPPRVTTQTLAQFLRSFAALDVAEARGVGVEVMLGDRIDVDRRDMYIEVNESKGGVIFTRLKQRDCDLDVRADDFVGAAAALEGLSRPGGGPASIYRAHVRLGELTPDLQRRLHEPSDQNQFTARPDGWSFDVGPIRAAVMDADRARMLGWMALSIHGQGYPWPRTHREFLEAVTSQPEVQAVQTLVRETWPIPSRRPGPRRRARRRMLQEEGLWFDQLEAPLRWSWCVCDS